MAGEWHRLCAQALTPATRKPRQHADDKKTRRSRTGYLIYLNMAPVAWLSKKLATIETSVFGAEFVAMKIGIDRTSPISPIQASHDGCTY